MREAHGSEVAGPPLDFARQLVAELAARLGDGLAGAYLHGSAVLGGWTASRSDVDVLVVLADGIGAGLVRAVGALLLGAAAHAPGRGLECSAVTAGAAAGPSPPWPFVLHVAQQAESGGRRGPARLVPGQGHSGDPDLLMHYAVARVAGVAVHGPPPATLIGPVPPSLILEYLAGELHWGLAHAPESYAVLNACRALAYLRDGVIVAKVAGGRMALARGTAPAALVRRALAQQRGLTAETPPSPDAVRFVKAVSASLGAAARAGRAGTAPAVSAAGAVPTP